MNPTRWRFGERGTTFTLAGFFAVSFVGCNALLGTDAGERKPSRDAGANDGDGATDPSSASDASPSSVVDGGGDDASSDDAGGTTGTGPGALGSLPFGYCCAANAECRSRRCEAVGTGGKMCLDPCETNGVCVREGTTFACDAPGPGGSGFCRPTSASFVCIPASQFVRGTGKIGDCCTPTNDGRNGHECEGNQCDAWSKDSYDGPFTCTQWCDRNADCPGTMWCVENMCTPQSFPYSCR